MESSSSLLAAIDMGTNSLKLLIAQNNNNNNTFLPILRRSDPVVLGRASTSFSAAIDSLRAFRDLLDLHGVSRSNTRCVATSALRLAENQPDLVAAASDAVGVEVRVISGEEEAEISFRSSLHFFPQFRWKLTLCVDIGGGSTEFALGIRGVVVFAKSLQLGHVTLTEDFRGKNLGEMRDHVRSVVAESGVVEGVERFGGFHVAVGSSGTIRALEKAAAGLCPSGKLRRDELSGVVESLISGAYSEAEKMKVFKRRSEFIEAGAVLLEEIFRLFRVEVMEVSRFGLLEGVVVDIMAGEGGGDEDRLGSVVRSVAMLGGKKRMIGASNCAAIAKEIFEEIRKHDEEHKVSFDDKDLEYLEAACLLHNIGLNVAAKKGYHKQSYSMIRSGDYLRGYSAEEVELIALLARHHRKKFPKLLHASFKELSEEVKKKFKSLCAIIRVSVVLWQYQKKKVQVAARQFSYKSFDLKLVLRDLEAQNSTPTESDNDEGDLRKELEYFKMVFHQDLIAIFSSKT